MEVLHCEKDFKNNKNKTNNNNKKTIIFWKP